MSKSFLIVSSSTSLSNTLSLIEGVIIFIKNLNNSKTQKNEEDLKENQGCHHLHHRDARCSDTHSLSSLVFP
jgi:hypothetical protein